MTQPRINARLEVERIDRIHNDLAGAAHHSVFTQAVDIEQLRTFADIMGIEFVVIDEHTRIPALKEQLRWNEVYYKICQ